MNCTLGSSASRSIRVLQQIPEPRLDAGRTDRLVEIECLTDSCNRGTGTRTNAFELPGVVKRLISAVQRRRRDERMFLTSDTTVPEWPAQPLVQ